MECAFHAGFGPGRRQLQQSVQIKGGRRWVRQCWRKRFTRFATCRSHTARKDPRAAHARKRFGSLVFNDAVQEKRLPKPVYHALRRTITHGESLDPSVADAVASALKDWAVEHGATHYTHWFQPLTGITAEKHDSFLNPTGERQGGGGVLRQGARQGRARRLELPVGRHALHLRSARLHGVGSDQPAVAAEERRRGHARHPDRVRELDRRGARQEDAAPAIDGSALEAGGARPEAVRLDRRARRHHVRSGAGILPDRSLLLSVAAGSDQRRADAVRRKAAEGPGAGRSVLRRHRRSRDGVHVGSRNRALQGRRAGEDAPQRSGAEPVRDRAGVRERQPRHRSSDDDDGDDAADGAEVRAGLPAAREAVRRRQRLGQAPQLVDERRRGAQPAQPGREHARQHPVPGVLRRRAARGQQVAGPAARHHRERRQRSPPRRERSAAGDPVGVPRRHADRHLRADREGRREVDQARRHARHRRHGAAEAAARRGRSQPHQPVRVHRQQVRVPRGLVEPEHRLPEHRAERGRHRVARLHRDRARESRQGRQDDRAGRRRSAAEGDQGEQADHLQRQQLLGGVGKGSRQARAAEPEEHRRSAAELDRQGGRRRSSRSTRSSTSASCTRATR